MKNDTTITRREALAAILAAPLVAALPAISELPLAASAHTWLHVVPSKGREVFLTSIFIGADAIPVADALRYTVNLSGMPV